jgi:hypothetical protein
MAVLPPMAYVNQFARILYGEAQYESEIQHDSGPNARFEPEIYDLGQGLEEMLTVEVWSKENAYEGDGSEQEVHLGSCTITMDSLRMNSGFEEFYTLLKDNCVVGQIVLQSNYEQEPYEELILDDILLEHERQLGLDNIMPIISAEPRLEHQLSMTQSLASLHPVIAVPMDPFADMESEICKAQEKRSVMQHQFRQSVIYPTEKVSLAEQPVIRTSFYETLYRIQSPKWVQKEPFRPKTAQPKGNVFQVKKTTNFAFANKVEMMSTSHMIQKYLDPTMSPDEIFVDQLELVFGQDLENVRVHKDNEEFWERVAKIREAQVSAVHHILKNDFFERPKPSEEEKAAATKYAEGLERMKWFNQFTCQYLMFEDDGKTSQPFNDLESMVIDYNIK